jgi:hypothetical protein
MDAPIVDSNASRQAVEMSSVFFKLCLVFRPWSQVAAVGFAGCHGKLPPLPCAHDVFFGTRLRVATKMAGQRA